MSFERFEDLSFVLTLKLFFIFNPSSNPVGMRIKSFETLHSCSDSWRPQHSQRCLLHFCLHSNTRDELGAEWRWTVFWMKNWKFRAVLEYFLLQMEVRPSQHHNNSYLWSQCSSMRCQQFYLSGYFAFNNSVFIGGWVYKTKKKTIFWI